MMMSRLFGFKYLPLVLLISGFFMPQAMAGPPGPPHQRGRGPGHPVEPQHREDYPEREEYPEREDYKDYQERERYYNKRPSNSLISVSVSVERTRRVARRYGYTGYRSLPPGIRKNLARGKPVPPGIAMKAVPTPLRRQLPQPEGYEWRVYGNDLVLVARANGLIAEVLSGVLR